MLSGGSPTTPKMFGGISVPALISTTLRRGIGAQDSTAIHSTIATDFQATMVIPTTTTATAMVTMDMATTQSTAPTILTVDTVDTPL